MQNTHKRGGVREKRNERYMEKYIMQRERQAFVRVSRGKKEQEIIEIPKAAGVNPGNFNEK